MLTLKRVSSEGDVLVDSRNGENLDNSRQPPSYKLRSDGPVDFPTENNPPRHSKDRRIAIDDDERQRRAERLREARMKKKMHQAAVSEVRRNVRKQRDDKRRASAAQTSAHLDETIDNVAKRFSQDVDEIIQKHFFHDFNGFSEEHVESTYQCHHGRRLEMDFRESLQSTNQNYNRKREEANRESLELAIKKVELEEFGERRKRPIAMASTPMRSVVESDEASTSATAAIPAPPKSVAPIIRFLHPVAKKEFNSQPSIAEPELVVPVYERVMESKPSREHEGEKGETNENSGDDSGSEEYEDEDDTEDSEPGSLDAMLFDMKKSVPRSWQPPAQPIGPASSTEALLAEIKRLKTVLHDRDTTITNLRQRLYTDEEVIRSLRAVVVDQEQEIRSLRNSNFIL